MNTPAHILIGTALFGRNKGAGVMRAAALGSLAPDASLYILAGTSIFLLGIPPQTVFGELYYSSGWQTVFAVDNSFLVWVLLFGAAHVRRATSVLAFAAAGLLHLALDLPLHASDGRPHFWPVSNWVFHSPVSYWDSQHHAMSVAPLSLLLCAGSLVLLWRSGLRWPGKIIFPVLLALEVWVARQWILFF